MALSLMLDNDFALVILDVMMPGMDGFETAELMRGNRKTRHIPIIFATADQGEKKHIFKGYDAGAVDYLVKPLEPAVLKGKVDVFLELQRQRYALRAKTRELDAKVLELEKVKAQLEERNRELKELSNLDALTGIPNRRRFDEVLAAEWKRGIRSDEPLSLIVADVDHFKAYNDHYGHIAGDFCLRRIARALASVLKRHMDIVARYGGEEFSAILPGTRAKGASMVAERMRNVIESLEIEHAASPDGRITVSFGVSVMVPTRETIPTDLVRAADEGLYAAKAAGRNCCHGNACVAC